MIPKRPCRDCGQAIMLVRTRPTEKRPKGGWMPLDPDPHPHGNVAIDEAMCAVVVGVDHPLHRGELHRHHKVTCPAIERPDPAQGRLDLA